MRRGWRSRTTGRGVALAAALCVCALAACSVLLSVGPDIGGRGRPDELFDWGSFSKQQESLSNDVEHAITPPSKAAILKHGREVVQQLHEFEDMVRPHEHKKTVPMDEELAMMKVQRQMRAEHRFPKDRVVGAGDVTAIVNEGDRALYDSAIGHPAPGSLAVAKDSRLFENCEDESLTVEDAELCQRRAGQIKDLTRAAVARQIADAPPVSPGDRAREVAKWRREQHVKELAAEALVGREYLQGRMGPGVFARAKSLLLVGGRGKHSGPVTAAARGLGGSGRSQELANTYHEYMPSGKHVVCTCNAAGAGDEEMEGLSEGVKPACTCKGGQVTRTTKTEQGGVLDTGAEGAWPQGLDPKVNRVDGYGIDAFKAEPEGATQQLASQHKAKAARPAKAMQQLASQHKAKAARPAKTPAARWKAAALGGPVAKAAGAKIGPAKPGVASGLALAGAKMNPLKHLRRPAAKSVKGIKGVKGREKSQGGGKGGMAGLKLLKEAVENAGGGKAVQDKKLGVLEGSIEATERELSAKKRLFRHELEARQATLMHDFQKEMREIQDGIQLTTGSLAASGPGSAGRGAGGDADLLAEARDAVLDEESNMLSPAGDPSAGVAASRKMDFRDASAAEKREDADDADKAEDKVGSSEIIQTIMRRAEQSRLYQHPPRPMAKGGPGGGARRRGEADEVKEALDRQFDEVSGGMRRGAIAGVKGRVPIQGLRLVSQASSGGGRAGAGGRGAGAADHVGPASFRQLSDQASKYLGEAAKQQERRQGGAMEARGGEVGEGERLRKNLKEGFRDDVARGGPLAELRDAETVLCTVEKLKTGECSGMAAAPPQQQPRAVDGDEARGLATRHDYLSVPSGQVPQVPTVSSLAGDLASSIGSFFTRGGLSN